MSELDVIKATPSPRTRTSLAHDLRQLGVLPGMILIVHSSLGSLGWVCGGTVAVVQALMDVVAEGGTIVMPTQTTGLSDPAKWEHPPVPHEWWQAIYDTMPVFNPQITPSYGMGQIVETFRTWPGVVRSYHPHVSFAAWGKHAHVIAEGHTLENSLGEGSPLARIYDLNGWVLLLGVGYDSCTSFHLAEYRTPGAKLELLRAPMLENGQHVWREYIDIEMDSSIFPKLGVDFEQTGLVTISKVGSATTRLFPQRKGVDFAVGWLTRKPQNGIVSTL